MIGRNECVRSHTGPAPFSQPTTIFIPGRGALLQASTLASLGIKPRQPAPTPAPAPTLLALPPPLSQPQALAPPAVISTIRCSGCSKVSGLSLLAPKLRLIQRHSKYVHIGQECVNYETHQKYKKKNKGLLLPIHRQHQFSAVRSSDATVPQ